MRYLLLIIIPLMPLQNVVDMIPKGPTGINFQNIILVVLFFGWWWNASQKRRPLVLPSSVNVPLALFIALNFLGMWRSSFYLDLDLPLSLSNPHVIFFKDYFTTMMFFWFAQGILNEEKDMKWLVLAMIAILPYMLRVHYSQLMAVSSWHYDHDLRVKGTLVHLGSNELAAFYVQYGALFLCLAYFIKDKWQKLAFIGAVAICLWGTLYSYSRASYIAVVVAVLIFGFVRSRTLIMVMLGFLLIAPALLPASVMDRIEMTQSTDGQLDESAASRLDFWALAWDKYLENPLQGIGLHAFHHVNPVGLDTHNLYVRQLTELGTFGIILFMILYYVAIAESVRLYREADSDFLKGLALGMVLCVVSNMLLNLFGDRGSYLALAAWYWVFLGMVVRGRSIVRARKNRPPEPEDDPDATSIWRAPKDTQPKASIFAKGNSGAG